MKKIAAILLAALTAAVLLAGCGAGGSEKKYKILDETLKDEEYAIAFRKGDFTLRDEVQKCLVELKKDGTLAEISEKWFGEDKIIVKDEFTPSDSTDDSLQKIKDKGEFILGFDESLPPMGFRNDEWEHDGFDIDVAKKVCEKMGVKLNLRPISWDAKDQELNTGNIDCIWNGFTVNEERAEKLTLSEPYMINKQVVVTLEGSGIETLEDLKGKRVTLQNGSTAEEALNSRADIVSFLEGGAPYKVNNNVVALNDLQKGGCDAVVMDEVVARYYVSHQEQLEADLQKASSAVSE